MVPSRQPAARTRRPWTAQLKPVGWGVALLLSCACSGSAPELVQAQPALPSRAWNRPGYVIDANVDFNLLTLSARERAIVPATRADPLGNAAFFLYANSNGIGGADERHHNLEVDGVTMGGNPVPWRLDGAVLHVTTPVPETAPFEVDINYHGIVPRAPAGAAEDMMGGLGSDISSLFGGGGQSSPAKPKNTDYGLYTYGDDILSLSAFWYAQLAVRENGHWADQPPSGLGDVGYSEKSDFQVAFHGLPPEVVVAAPGVETAPDVFRADNVREFSAVMSDQFVVSTGTADILGRPVVVTAYTLRKDAAFAPKALDVAIHALEIYSRRFGPYEYASLKVVEAPLRGGAGGMEYSSLVTVAEMVYGDMSAKMGGMISGLNLPGADQLLKGLEADNGDDGAGAPQANAPNILPDAGAEQGDDGAGGAAGGAANPANAVGGLLQEQDEIFKTLFEESLAHEVGHQWWCIAVGSDSERHPFLDESLTNWSSMLYWEDRYGKATAAKMIDLHLKTAFTMGIALGGGDKPANLPSDAYTNNLQYGAVIYGKAAIFYQKLRELVGDEAFFGALRDYYADYRDRLAGPDDLHRLMVARAPGQRAAIDALYQRWVNEAHGQEDLGSGTMGGIDLSGMLQTLMGSLGNLGDMGQ